MNRLQNSYHTIYITALLITVFLVLSNSCMNPNLPPAEEMERIERQPEIFPDYTNITIPPNIAPLNFMVKDEGDNFVAVFEGDKGRAFQLHANEKTFHIPLTKWKEFLSQNSGSQILIRIYKKGDEIEKVNLKTEETISAGVYPSWHPSGDYIAFSTNKIEQYFHADPKKTIEVLDRNSDLIIYNTITRTVSHVPGTNDNRHMETFPSWSPDRNHLYFCRSDAGAMTAFDSIRYDIFRIEFDPQKGLFGKTEQVFNVSGEQRSASFPRISPDGNYLLFTIHNYGTFPIWHKEADLCLLNLRTGKTEPQEIVNSEDTESFHSWSANNRWIVFSSRRYDGQYTKLYISYLNQDGQFQKAFLLPQREPEFYEEFFYSYNVPELITTKIQINPRRWVKVATGPR